MVGGATFPRTPTSGPPSGSTARLLFIPTFASVVVVLSSPPGCFPFPLASALRSLSLLLSPPLPPRPPRPRPPRPRPPPRPPPSLDEPKAWRAAALARSVSNSFSSSSVHKKINTRKGFLENRQKELTSRNGPCYLVIIDGFDGTLDELNVFFRKRLVKSHQTAVLAFGIFDIGSSTIKPFFNWILDKGESLTMVERKIEVEP